VKDIYWISEPSPGRLAIMPCPPGASYLQEHIRRLRAEGVDILVSLLPVREAALLDLLYESEICDKHGIRYLSFPIEDRTVPNSTEAAAELVGRLTKFLEEGKSVAIHCRAGIGRSALIAACVMVKNGMSAGEAFDLIRLARECDVPDKPAQRTWVQEFEVYVRKGRASQT
jgi:protein-tyrosine phosphatase